MRWPEYGTVLNAEIKRRGNVQDRKYLKPCLLSRLNFPKPTAAGGLFSEANEVCVSRGAKVRDPISEQNSEPGVEKIKKHHVTGFLDYFHSVLEHNQEVCLAGTRLCLAVG